MSKEDFVKDRSRRSRSSSVHVQSYCSCTLGTSVRWNACAQSSLLEFVSVVVGSDGVVLAEVC